MVEEFTQGFFDEQEPQDTEEITFYLDQFNMSYSDLYSYVGLKNFYGWHISDLKIYDKPKELSEFCSYVLDYTVKDGSNYSRVLANSLKRPPQSWCYVESLGE